MSYRCCLWTVSICWPNFVTFLFQILEVVTIKGEKVRFSRRNLQESKRIGCNLHKNPGSQVISKQPKNWVRLVIESKFL